MKIPTANWKKTPQFWFHLQFFPTNCIFVEVLAFPLFYGVTPTYASFVVGISSFLHQGHVHLSEGELAYDVSSGGPAIESVGANASGRQAVHASLGL